jgi:AcrR family transcriptional regulator
LYRYNTDKRVVQSAGLLFDALVALIETKKFDDIGIKELSEQAGIGRATFYRNFNYVEDVLGYRLDQYFEQLRHDFLSQPDAHEMGDAVRFFLGFWVQQADLLKLLLKAERWVLFERRFKTASELRILEELKELNLSDAQRQYIQSIINAQIIAVLRTWIERGQVESASELADILEVPYMIYSQQLPEKK